VTVSFSDGSFAYLTPNGGDPMVVIFTSVVSGQDEAYLEAYRNFVGRANSKDASFVSTL
jgi:hypothetical protein